ncbi:MAG TPA: hypothetical protein VH371_04650 [Candidatus Limnocylindrales bacterium]|jgi:hypothetical protein
MSTRGEWARLPRTAAVVAMALAVTFIASGCLITQYGATGIVIAATGPNVASVTDFTLRTAYGETIQFKVGVLDVNNGLPAPHLREHLQSGIPIFVTYHVDNGVNIATRYIDAVLPTSTTP